MKKFWGVWQWYQVSPSVISSNRIKEKHSEPSSAGAQVSNCSACDLVPWGGTDAEPAPWLSPTEKQRKAKQWGSAWSPEVFLHLGCRYVLLYSQWAQFISRTLEKKKRLASYFVPLHCVCHQLHHKHFWRANHQRIAFESRIIRHTTWWSFLETHHLLMLLDNYCFHDLWKL